MMLFACASSLFTPSPGAGLRPSYDGEVRVLKSYPDEGTYKHLGVVLVTARDFSNEANMIELMVQIAARRGANAIILQGKAIKVRTTSGR